MTSRNYTHMQIVDTKVIQLIHYIIENIYFLLLFPSPSTGGWCAQRCRPRVTISRQVSFILSLSSVMCASLVTSSRLYASSCASSWSRAARLARTPARYLLLARLFLLCRSRLNSNSGSGAATKPRNVIVESLVE